MPNKNPKNQKDALTMLKEEHKMVKKQLEELASTTERGGKRRTELMQSIRAALEAHTAIEEEIFYPAFRDAASRADDKKMYFEAVEEHGAVKLVLEDIGSADAGTPSFGGKAKVLKELVLHHAEEEEKEMFPRARSLFSKAELVSLGGQMAARKHELESAAHAAE